jgi:CBS domain-containing protein
MKVADLWRDTVTVVGRDSPIREAAMLMRRYHVGAIVVVDTIEGAQIPVGIVTDRDIVIEVVAMGLDAGKLSAGDIMSDELVTVPEDCEVYEAMARMRECGVRRMPIVDANGALTGIISLDDLLPLAAQELGDLARLPSVGRKREFALRH